MGRSTPVATTEPFEDVYVELAGTYQPGHPGHGPSYASGGDPPEPDGVEDVRAVGLFVELIPVEPPGPNAPLYTRVDLLAGLDEAAKAQVLANVLAVLGQDAAEMALLESVDEEQDPPERDDEPDHAWDPRHDDND